jgi:hypothetical protein
MGEYLMGSPSLPESTPNLNEIVLAHLGGDDIYLRYLNETPKMAPNSTYQGGRFALVQLWETWPELPQ